MRLARRQPCIPNHRGKKKKKTPDRLRVPIHPRAVFHRPALGTGLSNAMPPRKGVKHHTSSLAVSKTQHGRGIMKHRNSARASVSEVIWRRRSRGSSSTGRHDESRATPGVAADQLYRYGCVVGNVSRAALALLPDGREPCLSTSRFEVGISMTSRSQSRGLTATSPFKRLGSYCSFQSDRVRRRASFDIRADLFKKRVADGLDRRRKRVSSAHGHHRVARLHPWAK